MHDGNAPESEVMASPGRWTGKAAVSVPSKKITAVILLTLLLLVTSCFRCALIHLVSRSATTYTRTSAEEPAIIPFSCPPNTTAIAAPACQRQAAALSPAKHAVTGRRRRCPDYFRYIHANLGPWRATGITREAVESARRFADFRATVIGGRLYVDKYNSQVFQTRDVFTLWGLTQLLQRYPEKLPDLDLMFHCDDLPVVVAADFPDSPPPPLFRYCKDDATVDIVFPDWSFWGWLELNVKPWGALLEELTAANGRKRWIDREPYAFWKGNPHVSWSREDLLRCNSSRWNLDGRSWSVSRKYILACDLPVLALDTRFHDFFSRGLIAGHHFWPIHPHPNNTCAAVKFAVDWGNRHPRQAEALGWRGSRFVREQLTMDHVYDYMLHLLSEYAKLLEYAPEKPEGAVEECAETVACGREGLEWDFMMASRERHAAREEPCLLPAP